MTEHFFTYIILSLYLLNTANYMASGHYWQAWYWLAATQITVAATWGAK